MVQKHALWRLANDIHVSMMLAALPLLLLCRAAEPGSPPPGSPKPKPSGSPRLGPARRQGTCRFFDYF